VPFGDHWLILLHSGILHYLLLRGHCLWLAVLRRFYRPLLLSRSRHFWISKLNVLDGDGFGSGG